MGSLAVLLARPYPPRIETCNDKDAFVSNFWRAITYASDEVAEYADWPVSEVDLLARHRWLVEGTKERLEKIKTDPDYYDAKIAGWWVWGLSQWIGGGWCKDAYGEIKLPHLGGGEGIHKRSIRLPEQIPILGGAGAGIHKGSVKMPLLGNTGVGIHRKSISSRNKGVRLWFEALSNRLRHVRICCGEWDRILGPSPTTGNGVTGVLIDPPYESTEHSVAYAVDELVAQYKAEDVARAAKRWCVEHGDDPKMRIALCGYESKNSQMPDNWEVVEWKATGGYGNQGDGQGRENSRRERIWFSPHCLKPGLMGLLHQESEESDFEDSPDDWPVVATQRSVRDDQSQVEQPAVPVPPARRGGLFDLLD